MTLRRWFYLGCGAAVLAGLVLRFWGLRSSGFFFYDEGFYLHHNFSLLELVERHPAATFADAVTALMMYCRMALASGKSLWFMIMDARFFWGGLYDWGWPKVMAAVLGTAVLPLVWLFARRYFESRAVAALSVALAAVLPGLVFYSRIGLQEALSTCLVLGGFYLYLFPRRFSGRTVMAGVLFAAAFFSNYRLLMLPFLLVVAEWWEGVVLRRGIEVRRFVWGVVTFLAVVVLGGNMMDGANARVVFAWIFHQEEMAGYSFSWINFLSYPVYLFLLETVLFAGVFAAGAAFYARHWRDRALPVVLVLAQMAVFSLTSEKGARYLCVMLPFAVMAVAYALLTWYQRTPQHRRPWLIALGAVMALGMTVKAGQLAAARSDYEPSIRAIERHAPGSKILSTQDQVQSLYVRPFDRVQAVPGRFDRLEKLYNNGYRIMVLCPQMYVGLTTGTRFRTDLRDYLSFVDSRMTPVLTFPHMNHAMLERFVCEHNENLAVSLRFLFSPEAARFASIRVYDLNGVVPVMSRIYLQLLKDRR